jgi:hypothetical protein
MISEYTCCSVSLLAWQSRHGGAIGQSAKKVDPMTSSDNETAVLPSDETVKNHKTRFFSGRRLGCLALPLLLGIVLGVGGFSWQRYQQKRAQTEFIKTECTVVGKEVANTRSPGRKSHTTYHPRIQIRYDAAGSTHEIWTYSLFTMSTQDATKPQAIVDSYKIGQQYPCWYDPQSPERAVLTLDSQGHWFFIFFAILLGMICTIFVGFAMGFLGFVRHRLRR